MTEQGSDELLAELGDPARLNQALAEEQARLAAEERRASEATPVDDPGRAYPDPDEPPPDGEDHPEFDPLPPS
jgi:hypothetical protein